MPTPAEIKDQVARESKRRARLAVPAFGGGFLYLISAIIVFTTLNGGPTVGLVQGLTPALSGVANPARSPATAELKYLSHHAFTLLAGSVLAALSIAALTLVLLLLVDAIEFRRPQSWSLARPLVLVGGIAFAVMSVVRQATSAIVAHNFATGHDYSIHAFERATTGSSANVIVGIVGPIAGLALIVGMISVMINAVRVGLIPRWMSFVGSFAAILLVLPLGGAELQVVPAFWIVMMGILFLGRWPKGDPPAWAAGEARPWPSQAQMRAEAGGAGGRLSPSPAAAGVAPAPVPAVGPASSRKRRRKRSGRN